MRVQNISEQLILLIARCHGLMSAGFKIAKVQAWFSHELPANALICFNAVHTLFISMFPIDKSYLGKVAIKTSEELCPLESVVIGSMKLCSLVCEHQAHTRQLAPLFADQPGLADPLSRLYDEWEPEIIACVQGHKPIGYRVPAGLNVILTNLLLTWSIAVPVCSHILGRCGHRTCTNLLINVVLTLVCLTYIVRS